MQVTLIKPFSATLFGAKGIVFVLNGAIPDYDIGVVYYIFIPEPEYAMQVAPYYNYNIDEKSNPVFGESREGKKTKPITGTILKYGIPILVFGVGAAFAGGGGGVGKQFTMETCCSY